MNNEPGGALSLFDGMITGQTVELVPNQRIIQVWRAGNWPAGTYSLVKFELTPAADDRTVLHFEQIGFPEDQREHLESGWKNKYWDPLKAYLG